MMSNGSHLGFSKLQAKLVQATKRHQKGELTQAALIYKAILKEDPLHFDALHCMAILLFKKNEVHASVDLFRKALSINPDFADAHFNLGVALQNLRRPLEAITSFDRAIDLKADYALAYYKRGIALLELKRLDDAIASFNQAITNKVNYAEAYSGRGNALKGLNKPIEAIESFDQAILLNPNDPENYFNLGHLYYSMLNNKNIKSDLPLMATIKSLAILNYELAIKKHSRRKEIAEFDLSILKGTQTPARAPKEYVSALFDEYAANFDSHLLHKLQYKTPEILYKEIENFISNDLDILDIGCGTGLMGALLKPHAKKLIGLDLSSEMLKQANAKGIYDELIQSELNEHLKSNQAYFDLVVAADVLIYVGELEQTFLHVKKSLKESAYFCFTVEESVVGDYFLSSKARYTHSLNYCVDLAKKYDFTIKSIKKDILRLEDSIPVMGLFFCIENTQALTTTK